MNKHNRSTSVRKCNLFILYLKRCTSHLRFFSPFLQFFCLFSFFILRLGLSSPLRQTPPFFYFIFFLQRLWSFRRLMNELNFSFSNRRWFCDSAALKSFKLILLKLWLNQSKFRHVDGSSRITDRCLFSYRNRKWLKKGWGFETFLTKPATPPEPWNGSRVDTRLSNLMAFIRTSSWFDSVFCLHRVQTLFLDAQIKTSLKPLEWTLSNRPAWCRSRETLYVEFITLNFISSSNLCKDKSRVDSLSRFCVFCFSAFR